MIASLSGRRRRGAPDDRSLGCVLRPSGLATVRGAREAPGPTHTRARGTKNEPTSGPTPRSTIDPFHPARVRLRPVGNSYLSSVDDQYLGRLEPVAHAGRSNRALGAKDHPQAGRVGYPQGPLSGGVGHGPVPLSPVQANDSDALAV